MILLRLERVKVQREVPQLSCRQGIFNALKMPPDWPPAGQVTEDNEGRFNRPSVVLGSTKSQGGPPMSP